MRVLIVRLGAFGDIIHTLPLAADLHRAGHTVGWVCEDRWACVLQGSPAVRQVHQLPRKGLRSSGTLGRWLLLRRLARELRAGDRDILEPLLTRVGDQAGTVAELVLGPAFVRTGGCDG